MIKGHMMSALFTVVIVVELGETYTFKDMTPRKTTELLERFLDETTYEVKITLQD
jgi:hypothetical protein